MLKRVVRYVKGPVPNLDDEGLLILQYTNDTIIFMDNNTERAKHMKPLFYKSEQLSDLKVNFYISELFCYGEAKGLGDGILTNLWI